MEVYDGNSEKLLHWSVSTRLAVCCSVTKDSMQTGDFYQKSQTLKPGSRLKLRCDSPVRKLFFSCHDDVYLLPRKQEVHSTDRKRTSTGLTTDRGANSRKLTPRYYPQQQMYEHNISWQQRLFKKKKECLLSQRILTHSPKKWLLRF